MDSNPAAKTIVHFVTGGGSGATRVALDLALRQHAGEAFRPVLVLRRKRQALSATMTAEIARSGLSIAWVDDLWPKSRTVRRLVELCRAHRPIAFVAHGNSEHLWGRKAAIAAGVPVLVHVEHNLERYRWWRVLQSRRLAAHTDATVCVSSAVADHVRRLGIGSRRIEVIHNGIQLDRFAAAAVPDLAARSPDIVMAARFARQKDHATLVRAAYRLIEDGWTGRLLLAGGGKASHLARCRRLVAQLGLADRVSFLGAVADMPGLFSQTRVSALSTHYEGLPLVLAESMAARCAVVASESPGVTDIVRAPANGWLFPPGDDEACAAALKAALDGGADAQARADQGRADVLAHFTQTKMVEAYDALLGELIGAKFPSSSLPPAPTL